jgi:hypothetical protein
MLKRYFESETFVGARAPFDIATRPRCAWRITDKPRDARGWTKVYGFFRLDQLYQPANKLWKS